MQKKRDGERAEGTDGVWGIVSLCFAFFWNYSCGKFKGLIMCIADAELIQRGLCSRSCLPSPTRAKRWGFPSEPQPDYLRRVSHRGCEHRRSRHGKQWIRGGRSGTIGMGRELRGRKAFSESFLSFLPFSVLFIKFKGLIMCIADGELNKKVSLIMKIKYLCTRDRSCRAHPPSWNFSWM